MRSEKNDALIYPIEGDIQLGDVAEDGFQLRPHIVWFGEAVPLIETAADIAATADYFVVVGTSLAVYPAAGLLHYAPHGIPKFIIDKYIPSTSGVSNLRVIEMPATLGVAKLASILMQ
jgi:NAD-dependent deacetylase